jgi:ribose 5-phosphate isomerase RpiB
MKVYVAGDQKELCIRFANMINRSGNNCIISDEDSTDYRDLVRDIKDSYNSYDLCILISSDPFDACIEANRISGLRAAVCKDIEDAASAISAKSNLVVIDAAKARSADARAILKSVLDSYGMPAKQQYAEEPQRREKPIQVQPQKASSGGGVGGMFSSIKGALGVGNSGDSSDIEPKRPKQQAQPPQPQKKVQQKVSEYAPQPPKKKGKGGFLGSLKDTFGVD